jgi:hypothetical protein
LLSMKYTDFTYKGIKEERYIILKPAVESTTIAYCTDSSRVFYVFLPHRMGDTISAKNHQKLSRNQHISRSRYDSTAFFRFNYGKPDILLVSSDHPGLTYTRDPSKCEFLGDLIFLSVGRLKRSNSQLYCESLIVQQAKKAIDQISYFERSRVYKKY